jgi:hypothetical protein
MMEENLLNGILPDSIRTLSDLRDLVGELSEVELRLLADPGLYAEPTQAELERLGPDFARRIADRANERLFTRSGN